MAHKALKGRSAPKEMGCRKNMKKKRAAKHRGKPGGLKPTPKKVGSKKKAEKKSERDKSKTSTPEDAKAPGAAAEVAKKPVPVKVAGQTAKITKKLAKERDKAERQHKGLYSTGEKILLVGEGNFSFARSLAEHLESASGVCATGFDGESALNKKYPDAAEYRKEFEKAGGMTLVGVDATQLHKIKEFKGAFNKVVFNFPHIGGGESNVDKSVEDHRRLLASFFACAPRCLDKSRKAQIHVALKTGEPYKSWKVVQLARAAAKDFELRTALPFSTSAFPSYAHRRTQGFEERYSKKDNEELANGSKVYIFERDGKD